MDRTIQERADILYRLRDHNDGRVSLFIEEFDSDELLIALRHCNLEIYAEREGYIETTPNDSALRRDLFKLCDKYYPSMNREKAIDEYSDELFSDLSGGNSTVFNRLCYLHLNGGLE